MSNLTIALLASLAYFITYAGNWLFGQCMLERPLIVGTVTGLLFGDVTTGIILGGVLEAVYMGAVNIGGATSAEPVSATVMAVAFAITSGLNSDAAIALAVPVGLVFNSMFIIFLMASNFFQPWYHKVCTKGDTKGMTTLILVSWFLQYLLRTVIIFALVYLGSNVVQTFMTNLPQGVMNGLGTASNMLGAVGMAVLMKMLINRDNVGFLFIGFILAQYFELPAIVVAIIAAVVAVTIGFNDKKVLDLQNLVKRGGVAVVSEEEEFLND
ncbi:PTS sugar transporter subunit IIC [[Clostridium] innocuum]|nr:PTS sugar transporter subunit IIC [[Clostridium] innocuum]MCR0575605.1 PTS sugar transporter subunit IIC [[Clostridium] innocuum]